MITAAIVTILATLVAGSGAFTTTAQSADAYNKNDHNGNNAAADGNSQEGTRVAGRPVPGQCEARFDSLTADQKSDFEDLLPNSFSRVTTIEQLCTFLRNQVIQGFDPMESVNTVGEILDVVGVNQNTISNITSCVLRAVT
jgi:hypothetical protein